MHYFYEILIAKQDTITTSYIWRCRLKANKYVEHKSYVDSKTMLNVTIHIYIYINRDGHMQENHNPGPARPTKDLFIWPKPGIYSVNLLYFCYKQEIVLNFLEEDEYNC